MEVSNLIWTEELETGIENLDHQHKKYFDLLSEYLAKADMTSTDSERVFELVETLRFLKEYAAEHFSDEEQVMTEIDYPGLELHRKEHEYFLRHVQELYDNMREKGFSTSLARELRYYTVEWFVEHIRLTDMEFVQYLKETSKKEPGFRKYLRQAFQTILSKN